MIAHDFNDSSTLAPYISPQDKEQRNAEALRVLLDDKGAVAYTLVDRKMRQKKRVTHPVVLLASGPVFGLSSNLLSVSVPGYGSVLVDKSSIRPGRLAKAGLSTQASRALSIELNQVFA